MLKNAIWITGAEGRLGSALVELLKKDVDNKVVGTDMDVDITDMEAVEQYMKVYRPNIVINCASISDVQYCEQNMVQAFKVNALGARNLAAASRSANAKIIQLSTDDVFSGKAAGQLTEFDVPDPESVYGKSKYAGENYVKELNPKHLIVRSSWVYGAANESAKEDYFSYVVNHGKSHTPFQAPLDRIGSPTGADVLAGFIRCMLDKAEYGIYHASCEGMCSRHEFATAILALMGYDTELAKGYFSVENRGRISILLENLMMKMTEIYVMPQWFDELKAYIEKNKESV
ncbi:GDP-L-fucose synthase [Eubacterium plexicaudatum ASF492]|uniref:dTDP-4-dehydrorhamnose reductase n=1 Tax=Eubacterium plexicaudatum ASF492 TaxID=1235802 RepID=N2AJY2_9FIRM|nr:GDP-L-fucose synthase [Eubacterium plexicaudatum ASF492]